MFNHNPNTKHRQKWVKLKGVGLVSAVLLVSFLGVSTTHAEEVVNQPAEATTYVVEQHVEVPVQGTETGNPATNLPTAQPAPTQTQTQYVDNANTQTGSLPVHVDSTGLDSAVRNAEQAGITVIEDTTAGTTVTSDNSEGVSDAVKSAEANHDAQAKAIEDATKQHTVNVANVNAQNQDIAKQNADATRDFEDKKQLADSVNSFVDSKVDQIPGSTVTDKVIDYSDPTAKDQVTQIGKDNVKSDDDYQKAVDQTNKDNQQIAKDNADALAKYDEQLTVANKHNDNVDAYVKQIPSVKTTLTTIDFTGDNIPDEIKQLGIENDTKIADYQKALKDAQDKNAEITKSNADAKSLYDAQKSSVDSVNNGVDDAASKNAELKTKTEVIDYSKPGAKERVDAIKAENDRILAEYKLALEKLNQENEAIEKRNALVKAEEDEYNKRVVIAEDTKAGIKVTGQFNTDKRGVAFYSDIQVSYNGLDKTVKVADVIGWTDATKLVDAKGLTVYEFKDGGLTRANPAEKTPDTAGILSSSTGKYRLTDLSIGDSFILTNMGTTSDGVNVNMRLTVNATMNEKNQDTQEVVIGYDNMAGDGEPLDIQYLNFQKQGFDIEYLDDNGKPINLLTAFIIGDVDDGQSALVKFNGSDIAYVNPPGSLLTEGDNGLIHPRGVTSGFADAPNGTFLAVGLGTGLSYTHSSTLLGDGTLGVGQYYYIQYNLFGTSVSVPLKTFVYETPKTLAAPTLTKVNQPTQPKETPLVALPVAPTLVKVNTPEKPTPTPNKSQPVAPAFVKINSPVKPEDKPFIPTSVAPKLTFHKHKVEYTPVAVKTVTNEDGVDIDGAKVHKGDNLTYTLGIKGGNTLPAGRQPIETLVFVEPTPQGYVYDKDTVTSDNALYNTVFNEDGSITFTATDEFMKTINADLTEQFELTVPKIRGIVINDGAVYVDVYKLYVNKAEAYSNIVKNTTPGKDVPTDPDNPTPPTDSVIVPHKHAIDKDGKVIDGSTVPRNSLVTYRAEMDNDQYKGMVIPLKSHKLLQAFIDDYDETAMTPILDKVVIQDAEGKPANVFTMYHVLADTVLPPEVKEALDASGIKPKGAFILWVAKDNTSFINDYIVTGKDIIFYIPFQLNEDFKGGEFTNEVHQVNFGNGYAGNIVFLSTPEPEVPTPPVETPVKEVPPVPTPQTPVVEHAILPKTGSEDSLIAKVAGLMLLVFTLGLASRKRKEQN